MDFNWKSIVGTIAPTLGTALGGPLVGTAISVIGKAFGLTNATEAEVANQVQNLTPDMIVALKKAEQDFAVEMKRLDIKLEAINMKDRDSARDREIQTGDNKTPRMLAIGSIAIFMITLVTTIGLFIAWKVFPSSINVPTELWMILSTIVGCSGSYVSQAFSYYFGNNSGSEQRDKMLYENTPSEQKLLEAAASHLNNVIK